ncbi:hypothetical protein EWM64_g9715 [Hericium alpestre]|uniref:Uncharacterized protein n=1 Tax=Hericium alpestre TaxID=135208 RepID=A0A4Y9ZJU1_9AGAM|nr:hypothetical protein EWM64_g9715 [Hericium alpestre]
MPPRLSKRQQREQEELLALAGAATPDHVKDEGEEEEPSAPAKGGFAALMANSVDVEEESSEGEIRKVKKPKKKKKKESRSVTPSQSVKIAVDQPSPSPSPSASTPGPSKKERKALKKQKAKQKDGVDEIDQALQELSIKQAPFNPYHRFPNLQLAALLSVSLSHVDPDAEMRKFFGKKVVDAAAKASPGPSSARRQPVTQRSSLTRRPTWWPAKMREGLMVRVLSDEEFQRKMKENGWSELEERWWTVEYSKRYKGVTLSFMQTVMSGDPDGLYAILRRVPWHADTILQVAEIFSHREEHTTAADYIERALFTYERAFVGAFNFTSGINRLDFDRVENRPFYLAVHRYVIDLARRGAHRTAFEFARLLYGLDPWTDPHGALLHLDFLAIKAGMHQWLLDIFSLFDAQTLAEKSGSNVLAGRVSVLALPGWAYSRALAIRYKGGEDAAQESTAALKQAILSFPSVLPLLADKADISLSAEVRGHPAFKIFVKDW